MFNKKICLISAIAVCLILFSPLISLAQNPVEFENVDAGSGEAFDMRVADVDGDHIDDIIFVGVYDERLHVMYGLENGEFEPSVAYPVGGNSMITAYLNNDEFLDVICSYNYELNIFINDGDRTFSINSIPHEYISVGGVGTGFFNDDSYRDIIASIGHIYYGDGSGNFPTIDKLSFSFQTVYVSDFNNDNIDDVVALGSGGNGNIYLNNNDGSFTPMDFISLGGLALGTSIKNPFADFNHDGNADFAFVGDYIGSNSRITIGYGDGAGGIANFEYRELTGRSYGMVIADANRDNYLDLIASNISHSRMELYLGNEEGDFDEPYFYSFNTESWAKSVGTGDLDRDGNPDFVVGGYWDYGGEKVVLLMNQSPDVPVLANPMITTGYSNVGIDMVNPTGFKLSQNYKTVAGADYWRQDINLDNSIDERAIDYNLQYGEYEITINPNPDVTTGSIFSTTINIGQDEMILFKDYDLTAGSRALTEPFVFYYTIEANSSMQPANGSSVDSETPSFDWSGLVEHNPGVTSYQIEIDRYYDFQAPLVSESNLDMPQYTVDVPLTANEVYYWRFKTFDGTEWSEYSRTMAVQIVEYICGDIDGIAGINILDVIALINYKYKGGPAPEPIESGDVDGIPPVNILDVIYLINSIYKAGPAPVCVD